MEYVYLTRAITFVVRPAFRRSFCIDFFSGDGIMKILKCGSTDL